MSKKIAVYGTLRKGCRANGKLSKANFVGEDAVKGNLYNIGWFPGIRLGGPQDVKVEVYEVSPEVEGEVLSILDSYEGYREGDPGSLYFRKEVETTSGHTVSIYEYRESPSETTLIPSGDWMNR